MKVLHLFNTYLPKTQTWAFNLITTVPEEVYVGAYRFFADSWWDEKLNRVPFAASGVEKIASMVAWYLPIRKARTAADIKRIYVRNYIDRVLVPLCERERIDVIHAHFADTGYAFLRLKEKTGIPYVVSFYGMDYEYLPTVKPEYQDNYKKIFRKADGFVCEGENGKSILTNKYGVDEQKVEVIPLGIEIDRIEFVRREKKTGELNLVQVASFVDKKGYKYTIQAFEQALRSCPNATLTLLGSGDGKEEIKRLVQNLGLNEAVKFIDFIEYDKLHQFLASFHVFIHPSCYSDDHDCEGGAPIVLLDAQCTGMPILSTTHCDIPSEVLNGETGLLSPEKDVDDLSKNIAEFYNMGQDEYSGYCRRAREHVLLNYSVQTNSTKLFEYHQILIK